VEQVVVRANKQAAAEVQKAQAAQMKVQADLAKIHGDFFRWGGGKGARVLIVPAEQPQPETVSDLEEDLTVMARVLEKALDSKDRHPTALGIDVLTFSGAGSAQHLYVGGHGAIFNFRVKFPLSAPAVEKTKTDSDDETSSTWEDAKRDIFGTGRGLDKSVFKQFDGQKEEYDSAKVDRLKDSIIDSLKHAAHIRHLTPDERVTVVVTTAAAGPFEARIVKNTLNRAGVISRVEESREKTRPESVLTIQAKKSDIDAFAKGKLDADSFRKKVQVMTY
jgi:hypothetical protein